MPCCLSAWNTAVAGWLSNHGAHAGGAHTTTDGRKSWSSMHTQYIAYTVQYSSPSSQTVCTLWLAFDNYHIHMKAWLDSYSILSFGGSRNFWLGSGSEKRLGSESDPVPLNSIQNRSCPVPSTHTQLSRSIITGNAKQVKLTSCTLSAHLPPCAECTNSIWISNNSQSQRADLHVQYCLISNVYCGYGKPFMNMR